MQLFFKKISEGAKIPTYGSAYAAGMDLYSSEDTFLPALGTTIVKTGITMSWKGENEHDHYLRIAPRSGVSVKGIFVNAGVIDYDYRGEIKVVLYNTNKENYIINKGDRIAQMILEKIKRSEIIELNENENHDSTERGVGGFGSTGI